MSSLQAEAVLRVELGDRSYPITIASGGLGDLGAVVAPLAGGGRLGVVTDARVDRLYGEEVRSSMARAGLDPEWVVVPEGEGSKSLDTVSEVLDRLLAARLERGSPIVAVGGGVVGDLGGFVASILLRGVPYVQVPTTLLAQVDSSVGGKTGVNSRHGKNLVGSFYQPRAVYAAVGTLLTLEERDLRAGLAEVVKYGVIADAALFDWVEEHAEALIRRDTSCLLHVVRKSCEIKADIVGRDERESGVRSLLNFGHTAGHAVEAVTGYGAVRHGEAVAMGMVFAARLSREWGLASEDDVERLRALIGRLGLPGEIGAVGREAFLSAMAGDKKVSGGALKFVVMRGIGRAESRSVAIDALPETMESAVRRGLLAWA